MPDPVLIEIPGMGVVEFPATMPMQQIEQAAAKLYADKQAQWKNAQPARTEDFIDRPAPVRQTASGQRMWQDVNDEALNFVANAWQAIKPWDRPSDIVTGPFMAVQHPLQSLELLWSALRDAHVGQAQKGYDAAERVLTEPTMSGKAGALGESMLRGAAAVVPMVGPAVAGAVDQMAAGDVSGGAGRLTGIAGSAMLGPEASAATRPARAAVAGRLTRSAEANMAQALNPTRIATKAETQRVVPDMLRRRVAAPSLQKLEALAAEKSNTAGAAVGRELATRGNVTRETMPMVERLERAKADYVGTSADGRTIVNEAAPVKAIEDLQNTLMEYGDSISVESMAKLRRNWDETVKAANGFAVADLGTKWAAWARREGRAVLRDELAQAAPDLKKLNAEFSFWESVEDVAHATNQRRTGQSRGLLPTIAASGGAAAADMLITGGASTATKIGGTLLTAKAAASLKRVLESPGWKMFSAVQKQRLADALASRNPRRIADAIGQAAAAVNGLERGSAKPTQLGVQASGAEPPKDQ